MQHFAITSIIAIILVYPAQAHHNYFMDFNPKIEVTLEGVVSKVDFRNPHITVYLDVTDEEGNVYEGEMKDGKKHGIGKKIWKVGHIYEGIWKLNERDGFGK